MKYAILLLLILTLQTSQVRTANWPLDEINATVALRGVAKIAAGASGKAMLFLNGKPVGEVKLQTSIAAIQAPNTLGGIWDGETCVKRFTAQWTNSRCSRDEGSRRSGAAI